MLFERRFAIVLYLRLEISPTYTSPLYYTYVSFKQLPNHLQPYPQVMVLELGVHMDIYFYSIRYLFFQRAPVY